MNWTEIAYNLGYESEGHMWYTLYTIELWSVNDLASRFQVSTATISRRLKDCRIEVRSRGGKNHIVASQTDKLKSLDQRFVRFEHHSIVLKEAKVSITTLRNYRRSYMETKWVELEIYSPSGRQLVKVTEPGAKSSSNQESIRFILLSTEEAKTIYNQLKETLDEIRDN